MDKYFCQGTSILLLALSILAFSDNLITDVGQESNSDPKFVVHGLFMLAWFILYVVETTLIVKKNYSSHMKVGLATMFVGVGVFVSTLWVFVAIYEGWEAMEPFVKANRFFMLSFAVLVTLGYRFRKDPAKHKRLMYLANILILEPIIGRVTEKLYIDNWELFYLCFWNLMFIILFAYDWKTLKKIHTVSWAGFLWFYLVWAFAILS